MIYDIDKNELIENNNSNTIEPLSTETPRLYWLGSLPTTKADGAYQGILRYKSSTLTESWYATLKVQGDSSTAYAKKNFTITLYTDNTYTKKLKFLFKDWGATSSFVMKAHWIDHSHIRNISCALIWEEIMESRDDFKELPNELQSADGHGATKGFSFRFWANGLYYGLYEMILVKKSIFGQDKDNENHSLLNSDWNNLDVCVFNTLTPTLTDGWTEELLDAIPESANTSFCELIKLIARNDDEEILANIDTYLDVLSVIDYDIFARVFCVVDNLAKNQIFATYDGTKWFEGAWDLDGTCGNPPTPSESFFEYNTVFQDGYEAYKNFSKENKLYTKIEELYLTEFRTRYFSLRESVLDVNHIIEVFEYNNDRVADWLDEDYAATTGDGTFTTIPNKTTNNIQLIRSFISNRLTYMDNIITELAHECVDPIVSVGVTKVTITCATDGASIYYTLDGSDPTESSTLYSAPFEYTQGTTCKCVAIKADYNNSNIVTTELTNNYQVVEYVVENGFSGFMTDYIPNENTEIEYQLKFDETNFTGFAWGRHFLSVSDYGTGTTTTINNFYCPVFRTRGNTDGTVEIFAMTGGSTEYTYTLSSYDLTNPYKIEIKDNKITINDEDIFTDITISACEKPFAMFSLNDKGTMSNTTTNKTTGVTTLNSNVMSDATFYYCTIWENDVIVRHYIPVYNTSTSSYGIYEEVNGNFYVGVNGFNGPATE